MADGFEPDLNDDLKSRRMLLRRLTDVVALPDSLSSAQDRAIAGDLLLEMLIDANEHERELCARRLSVMSQAPVRVLRFLASDIPAISNHILEESEGLDEAELVNIVRNGGAYHRKAIASRKEIGPCLSDALAESDDIEAIERLLINRNATLSELAIDHIVTLSRKSSQLTVHLMRRPELRPAHALAMFWWSKQEDRKNILMRFAAERSVLIDMCADIFAIVAEEDRQDPNVMKTLQVIERRQRNRESVEASEYVNLEDAIARALKEGMTTERLTQISIFCGVKPITGDKIFKDPSGEGVAVLAKAVGLKRQYFKALWAALGRPISRPNAPVEHFERVLEVYEMLAVAKAQTVIRYWNWSLSTAFSPDLLDHE